MQRPRLKSSMEREEGERILARIDDADTLLREVAEEKVQTYFELATAYNAMSKKEQRAAREKIGEYRLRPGMVRMWTRRTATELQRRAWAEEMVIRLKAICEGKAEGYFVFG
jgi:hypothetical protein